MRRFGLTNTFSARKAVSLGAAGGGCLADPKKIFMKLRVNGGQASAQQLRRVLLDTDVGQHAFVELSGRNAGTSRGMRSLR